MKLDPDCIRDILIEIEDHSATLRVIPSTTILNYPSLKKYDATKILYHFNQLDLDGMLIDFKYNAHGEFSVRDLSPNGHRFLSNIRNNNKWIETKNIIKQIGGFSMSMLTNVAQGVMTAYIRQQLHL